MANRKSVSLSALFSEACKRIEVATEQAMGCERVGDTLILYVSKDHKVEYQLVEDQETGQVILGEQIADKTGG